MLNGIFIKDSRIRAVFVVYSTFQLFLMSFLAFVLKKEFCDCEIILVIENNFKNTLKYFNEKIWDEIYVYHSNQRFSMKNIVEYYKEKRMYIKEIDKIIENIAYTNLLFFSSGNRTLVQDMIKRFKEAIVVCVGEGCAGYHLERKSTLQNIKKLIVEFKIDQYLFGIRISDSEGDMDGGEYVSLMLDTKSDKLTNKFRRNRLVFEISTKGIFDNYCEFVNKDVAQMLLQMKELYKGKTLLFLSQNLSECNLISLQEELSFLKKMKAILDKYLINLWIKPHPGDSEEKIKKICDCGMNVHTEWKNIPFEIFSIDLKVEYIASVNSSSLMAAIDRKNASQYIVCQFLLENEFLKGEKQSIESYIKILMEYDNVIVPNCWNDMETMFIGQNIV